MKIILFFIDYTFQIHQKSKISKKIIIIMFGGGNNLESILFYIIYNN